MNMAFDLETTGVGGVDGAGGIAGRRPSWPELIARMVAARQASGALGPSLRSGSNTGGGSGSFHEAVAAILAAQGARPVSVNPNDLGNRKSGGATASPVAGETSTGVRGKQ